jgi:hypothetical protein
VVPLVSLPSWRSHFPHVAEIVDGGVSGGALGNSNCTVIHVQTSINTMTTSPPAQSLLCTQFEVAIPTDEFDGYQWECVMRIYAPGKIVWELSHICSQTKDADGTKKLTLPFASDFWSAFYTGLSAVQSGDGKDGGGTNSRRREKEAKAAIKGINVVQELFAISPLGSRERTGLLLWEFTKSDPKRPGKAIWREISLPPTGPINPASTQFGDFDGLLGTDISTDTSNWETQQHHKSSQQPQFPISPYEEPSSTAGEDMGGYYTFEPHHSSSFAASGGQQVLDDLGLPFYPQAAQQGLASFGQYQMLAEMGMGSSIAASLEQYLGGSGSGVGAENPINGNEDPWSQHLSPISECGVVENVTAIPVAGY